MKLNSVIRNIQLVGVIFILVGTVLAFGFEINALGFAGYLLATSKSKISWLEVNGLHSLLNQVVEKNY